MADARRNLHQVLKGKQLYSTLYGVYTEVPQDLTAVTKESASEGERAKTITMKPKGSTRNFFAALRSIEILADYRDDAVDADDSEDTTESQ
jgi:hypothetical protein